MARQRTVQRLFVSYAREDRRWAEESARIARGLGITVFLDLDSLRAGESWPDGLRRELETADQVWLGWSKHASQSEWVKREYSLALKKGPRHLRIYLLDSTPLPPELAHIQAEQSAFAQEAAERLLREPTRKLPEGALRPSILLRPEYGIVPFTRRRDVLEHVDVWCLSDALFGAELYVGPGGAGKTRLFIEACRRLKDKGWDTGFLDRAGFDEALTAAPEVVDSLLRPRLPRLIVLDYAETRREQVKAIFRRAVSKKSGQPVRVVLLARSAADWWTDLVRSSFEFQQLLGPSLTPQTVTPLAPDAQARSEIFESAAKAFAQTLDRPIPEQPLVDFSGPEFDRALFLHFAALYAVLDERASAADELLEFALDHEERYWASAAEDLGLDQRLRGTLNAAAASITLAGGCGSREELLDILALTPDLKDASRLDRKMVGDVFSRLYAFNGGVEALQPDLLGEHLVARALLRDTGLLESWFGQSDPQRIHHGLTLLDRMARDNADASRWLANVLSSDLVRLALPAMSVAIETGDPIGKILSESLDAAPNSGVELQLEKALPQRTVALRELAVSVTVGALRALPDSDERSAEQVSIDRARLLNDLGSRLSKVGRREEALNVAEKAVALYRELVEARPDAFLPNLARSLNNLGNRRSELGGLDKEALAAEEEALQIWRKLAKTDPGAFLLDLAICLDNLGACLNQLERPEEALVVAREAVDIHRALWKAHPPVFLPGLAESLHNLAVHLDQLGNHQEALKVGEEAADFYRELVQARPDAFKPGLARILSALGVLGSSAGRHGNALAAANEAVGIYQDLVRARPDAFDPDLARSLTNLASVLCNAKQPRDALAAEEEALQIWRKLAKTDPDAFLPDLARSLNNLVNILSKLGRREEALAVAEEAVRFLLPFFQSFPQRFKNWMVPVLRTYSACLAAMGREADPELYRTVTAIFKELEGRS